MEAALRCIEPRVRELEAHPFFASLIEPEPDVARAVGFAPFGAFWVLTFQDVIRINANRTVDPVVRRSIEQHLREDTGHHLWFLDDVAQVFGLEALTVGWLFSEDNLPVREISFALVSEVYRIENDYLRLVFLEALEAAAATFFARIARHLAESGHAGRFKYFGGVHLEAEDQHEMHSDDAAVRLKAITLSEQDRREAERMVGRMFDAFNRFADFLSSRRDHGFGARPVARDASAAPGDGRAPLE